MRATIEERGCGLADAGDYVRGDDGEVYRVVSRCGRIQTHGPGQPNTIDAVVEIADWSDVTDDTEPVCTATIEEPEDAREDQPEHDPALWREHIDEAARR